ncbi:MAG TPA: hypothetical protein VIM06_07895 [Rhodanobacter sp.]
MQAATPVSTTSRTFGPSATITPHGAPSLLAAKTSAFVSPSMRRNAGDAHPVTGPGTDSRHRASMRRALRSLLDNVLFESNHPHIT